MTGIYGGYGVNNSLATRLNRTQPTTSASPAGSTDTTRQVASNSNRAPSTTKPFAEVALDARSSLDASYEAGGLATDMYTNRTGSFRRDVFDAMDFDRRTLYAIASNEGGQFSEVEMHAAKSAMHDQLANAMVAARGLTGHDHVAGFKAAIEFLDRAASPEEKASFDWAKERAAAQSSYELKTKGRGEDVGSNSPVVKLLMAAYDELFAAYDKDLDQRLEDMPSFARALQQWGFSQGDQEGRTYSVTL